MLSGGLFVSGKLDDGLPFTFSGGRASSLIHTFGDLHLGDGLPLVHGDKPSIILPPAAEIDDKFGWIISYRRKH